MAYGDYTLPYGCRDIGLRQIDTTTNVAGTTVKLPFARKLGFTETADSTDLEANDTIVASHENKLSGEFSIESGGISFAAWAILTGGTVTTTGTTPNRKKRFRKKSTDSRPYFQVEGQMISDSGGDLHVVIHRARITGDIEGEFTQGEFYLTSADGQLFPSLDATTNAGADINTLYDIIDNETVTAIV